MRTSFSPRWPPALLWATAIFYLSSQSRPLGRRWSSPPSALAHVFEFAVLAALLHRVLAADPRRQQRAVVSAFALTALYAASDEVHQVFVPERKATPVEYGLDLLGALLGLSVRQWLVVSTTSRGRSLMSPERHNAC
jgi:VanZ family protein